MKKNKTSFWVLLRRFSKKIVYKSLLALVDFSESVYLRLKYFKFNYKKVFAGIFDEEDRTINTSYRSDWPKNKYVNYILSLLLSIFAYQIPQGASTSNSNMDVFSVSDSVVLDSKVLIQKRIQHFSLALLMLFLILSWYAFT